MSFLRSLDMNKMPFNMSQVTHVEKGEKKYDSVFGSKIGGFYTLCALTMVFAYFMSLIIRMFSADLDEVLFKNLIVDFDDPNVH